MFLQPLGILMFCLALGFLLGRVKCRYLPANSTLATLIIAIVINVLLREFDVLGNSSNGDAFFNFGELKSFGFVFFSFAIGYSAGPKFVDAIKSGGWRFFSRSAIMACVYCFLAGIAAFLAIKVFSIGSQNELSALLAGALTQNTILTNDSSPVAYGISYIPGLVIMIFFVQMIAPRLLGMSLVKAVRLYCDTNNNSLVDKGFSIPAHFVQMRAYRIVRIEALDETTVGNIEKLSLGHVEIVSIYSHNGKVAHSVAQDMIVNEGDVIVTIGAMHVTKDKSFTLKEELESEKYFSDGVVFTDVVLSENLSDIRTDLTNKGILLRSAIRDGKMLSEKQLDAFQPGDVVQLAGLAKSIDLFVEAHGYKHEDSAPADLFSVTFILAIAITLGAISIFGISIGSGCCALLLGLCLGWANKLRPDIAHIPSPSLTLLRSLGLNLFIASVALSAELIPEEVFSLKTLTYFGCSTLILAIPIIGTYLVAYYVLRLSAVEALGGLCGCGTCTPALNALEEETGSSVFTAAYTIPYVVGNILLTIMGSLVVNLVK